MERSNSTRKGKRILDPSQDDEEEERPAAGKRPTLASVILESHKMDLLKLLEPDISRIVSEKVELAISRFCSPNITVRCSTKQIEGPYQRNLKLHFRSGLSLPLFTERKVAGEQGAAIQVVLLDATTGHVVISGPESSVKLDVVVLEGDFNNEDDEDWTQEEFESHVVKKREGKRPLLIGDLQVKLKEGVGTLGNLKFTDNSSWIRSKKFRIGLKVPSGHYEGIRIQEAKTDAFSVKDHRGELSKKHYPPKLDDEVWRLEKIAKDGQFHKRLQMAGICTVEDFLLLLRSDPKSLKLILGGGMTNKIWEALVDHAGQCISNGKLYVYHHHDDSRNIDVIFNDIYELLDLTAGNYRADSGSYSLNVNADGVVKKAYNNEVHIVEYDGNTILNFDQPTTEIWRTPDDTFNKQASPQCSPIPIIPERPTMETGLPSGGTSCNENPTAGCSVLSQTLNSKFHLLFGATSSPLQNQPMGTSHQAQIMRNDGIVSLTPGSSHSSISGFLNEFPSNLPTNFTSNDDLPLLCEVVDPSMKEVGVGCNHDYLSQSFCTMSEGLPSYVEANINGYSFLSSVPSQQNCSQDEGRIHSSWKAVPQWLMLKGVVMWRIRARNKAKKAGEMVANFFILNGFSPESFW